MRTPISEVSKLNGGFEVVIPTKGNYIIPGVKMTRCHVRGTLFSVIPQETTVWGTGPTIYHDDATLILTGGYGIKNDGSDNVLMTCMLA